VSKIIVIDLDRVNLPTKTKLTLNESKICTLTRRDFGKKTLLKCTRIDSKALKYWNDYKSSIYRLKDDDAALKHENRLFKKLYPYIKHARIGIVLNRDKACKILLGILNR